MISLIVCTYKNDEALAWILYALDQQTFSDFEVIVAEDAQEESTRQLVEEHHHLHGFSIHHLYHPDDGFRKTTILNAALRCAQGEQLVFIDGDCIPHPHFLEEHHKNISPSISLSGRRVRLHPDFWEKNIRAQQQLTFSFWQIFLGKTTDKKYRLYLPFCGRRYKDKRGILGCNWSILRDDLLKINGFDEDYKSPGFGEDSDVMWRLQKAGISNYSIAQNAILYHLEHPTLMVDEVIEKGIKMWKEKEKQGLYYCPNGYHKSSLTPTHLPHHDCH